MAGPNDQEVEAKFLLRDLDGVRRKLQILGAQQSAERVLEVNLRFDNANRDLARQRQVLRLRRDANAVMTFKGPAQPGQEVSVRQEIEFIVSDFGAARRLLEALGYQVVVSYEKYRATYNLGGLTVVLDEMPYGDFLEIEGPDADAIRAAAGRLGLRWSARSALSYLALFDQLRAALTLPDSDLTFEMLQGVPVRAQDLGLEYAD